MDYLLKASGLVILLFLFYYTFLKNETFFKSIRGYFLVGLILVISIPVIEIPIYVEQVINQINAIDYSNLQTAKVEIEESSINFSNIATYLYLFGVLFLCVKFLIQLFSLGYLISKHQFIKQGNYYFIETSNNISPFSFFNIIIYNKSNFTIEELQQIINHEKAHALQWHSIDTILAHLLVITLWFNPFVWLYKKAVQQNLEFLADEYALELAQNEQLYKLTLLKTCHTNYCTEITNNFYNSLIKTRIIMLQKNRSTKKRQWKYALLLPLLAAFIVSFNTKIVAQESKLIEVQEIQESTLYIITKYFQKEDLDKLKLNLQENGITFSYNNLKYNNKNELVRISIKIKNEKEKVSASWNTGSEPISNIKVGLVDNHLIASSSYNSYNEINNSYSTHDKDNHKFKGKPNKDGNFIFVTSVGEVNTWSSKSLDTIVLENKIIKKEGDNKHVWAHKNDDNVKIEIIEESGDASENVFIIKKEGDQTFKINEDNASENVYIIKNPETGKIEKQATNIVVISPEPLIIINGKEITSKEMEAINHENIESINVLKDESADKKYGDKGKNGVIEIKLKDTDYSKNLEPLFIVDEKETPSKEAKEINPDNIKSMYVLNGAKAIEKYGRKAENGVVEITTKQD